MKKEDLLNLSKREQQIMDVVYRRGSATAMEITESISNAPSHSAVRALIRILETKGHLTHAKDGARFVYSPMRPASKVRDSALKKVVQTFFGGSVEGAVAALLTDSDSALSSEELDRISQLIKKEKKGGSR